MNTQELKEILACVPNLQICASNELEFTELPFYAIVNSEDSQSDGLHWLALYFYKKGQNTVCIYFDSLGGGLFTMVKNIKQFVFKYSDKIHYNSRQIQALDSSVCGLYSSYFIICMQQKINYDEFLAQFSKDVKFNDQQIFSLFYESLQKLGQSNYESKGLECKPLIKSR